MQSPYDRLLDLRPLEARDGEARYAAIVDERHHNPIGRVHGGLITSLADAAMGAAVVATTDNAANINIHIEFIRGVSKGRLEATARLVHRGRTRIHATCDVTDETGLLVARASSDFLCLQEKTQTIGS